MVKIEELKHVMDQQGLNISSLASKSGVDKAVISRLLNGETVSCSIGTAHKLSDALGLSGKQAAYIFLA